MAMYIINKMKTGQLSSTPNSIPESAWRSISQAFGGTVHTPDPNAIPPADRAQYELYFDKLDSQKKGFIGGAESVAFFKKSNLPEQVLAQIWYGWLFEYCS